MERNHHTPAGGVESNRVSEDSIMNLYVYRLAALASGQGIARMKERWLAEDDFDVGDNDDDSERLRLEGSRVIVPESEHRKVYISRNTGGLSAA